MRWRLDGTAKDTAFTLVELLVVIAIIGVLVALLLPAIQSAREAARKTSCANKSKQIALAVLNYESSKRVFPPSCDTVLPVSWNRGHRRSNHGWLSLILPYLEETARFDQINFEVSSMAFENELVAATIVPAYLCPSYDGLWFSEGPGYQQGSNGPRSESPAIGNYVSIGAIDVDQLWTLDDESMLGIISPLGEVHHKEVKDGLTHTILATESLESNMRVWIDGRVGAFTTTPLARPQTVSLNYVPYYARFPRAEYGPSSAHSGGANHSFADGSVRFLSEQISFPAYAAFTTYSGHEINAE